MMSKKTKRILSLTMSLSIIGGDNCTALNMPIERGIADNASMKGTAYNIERGFEENELNKDTSKQCVEGNIESELAIYNETTDCAVRISTQDNIGLNNNYEEREQSSAEIAANNIKNIFEEYEFNKDTSKEDIKSKINLQLEVYNKTTDCAVRINTQVGEDYDGFERFYNDSEKKEISFKVALVDEKQNNSTLDILRVYSQDENSMDEAELLKNFEIKDDNKGGIIITKYKGQKDIETIPEKIGEKNVTAIGNNAFWKCSKVKKLYIPSTVKSIGASAFAECGALTDIYINNDISIGPYAFYKCNGLKNIEFSYQKRGMNVIVGNYAFYDCRNLKQIKNQHCIGRIDIGKYAFNKCISLEEINIPKKTTTQIGEGAFCDCSSLIGNEDGIMIIPDNVTSIGKGVFYGCSRLTKVDMGNVRKIGDNAFSRCTSLMEIDLSKVEKIGDCVFECSGLTSIKLPDGINKINDSTFRGCSKLTEVIIPDGTIINSIGNYAFNGCQRLNYIDISKAENIGDYAFYGCRRLNNVDISNVKSIGDGAFRGCSGLSTIDIPNVKNIGNDVFSLCSGLTSISMPETVESIGEYAFYGCNALTSIDIPKATNIEGLAFCQCSKLKSISLPEDTKYIGMGEFYECSDLKKIEIPETVESIGTYAFYGCNKLENAIIPDNIANHRELEKLNSECEIIYKTNNESYALITDIKAKTDNSKIVIPEKIYDKQVNISDEAVDKLKNCNNQIEIYTRKIYNSLIGKIDLNRITMISDKSQLQSLYDTCMKSGYDSSKFTESSYTLYKNALESSKDVIDDKYSDQSEINKASEQLLKSMKNLEIKTDSDNTIPGDSSSDNDVPNNSTTSDDSSSGSNIPNNPTTSGDSSSGNNASNNHKSSSHTSNRHKSSSHKDTDNYTENTKNEIKDNNGINLEEKKYSSFNMGWNFINGKWFYILSDGNYFKGWYRDTTGIWYMLDRRTGEMVTGWFKDTDGKWYFLNESGAMKTGWLQDVDGKWYFLDVSGAMIIGWLKDMDGKWYYFYDNGSMAVSTYIGPYRVGKDGAWIK